MTNKKIMEDNSNNLEEISKTEKKRIASNLQILGEKISKMKPEVWNHLPISDSLNKALQDTHKHSKNFGSLKRHMQFIGKLMKKENIEDIEKSLIKFEDSYINQVNKQAQLWHQKLLENDNLQNFIKLYPNCDIQNLRNIIRQALKEENYGANKRKLFQTITNILKN